MSLPSRPRRQSIVWFTVLFIFALLLALANKLTDGERFYGAAPVVIIGIALLGLFQAYRATADSSAWGLSGQQIRMLALGTAAYTMLAYAINDLFPFSLGPVALRPQVCVPILFGYAFGPTVGFFTGAVGSLMGDFVVGFGVFPAWHIASGLTGFVPGLVANYSNRDHDVSFISNLVIVAIAIAAAIVFVHPRAPEPWTGEVQNYAFWGYALVIGGLVMLANTVLLQEHSAVLAAAGLWGTLGILAGNVFASLAHIFIYGYGLSTALIAEFAPAVATDMLNLIVFTPIVLACYRRLHGLGPARSGT